MMSTSLEKLEPTSWLDGQTTFVMPLLQASLVKPERIFLAQVMHSVRRRKAFATVRDAGFESDRSGGSALYLRPG